MTNTTKKGKFADKGKSILNPDKPKSMDDFLKDKDNNKSVRKDGNTESRKDVKKEIRTKKTKPEKTVKNVRKDVKTASRTEEKKQPKTVREEFRLPYDLAEKLRKHSFDNRVTKTKTVVMALEQFLDD